MNKIVNTKNLTHKEWLKLRQQGIGGSDAGAIVGLNPYQSPVNVYLSKVNPVEEEQKPNEAMRLGSDLEDYVAKRWEEATGKKVKRNNWLMSHSDYPHMIANIDREVVGEKAILECKTANVYSKDKWKDGHIPEQYVIQCLHYLAVTGAERCYLACLIFGQGVEFRTIERDEEAINNLIKLETDFWNDYVTKKIMPPPDGSKASEDAIKELYPVSKEGEEVVLNEYENSLKRLDDIEELMKELKTEEETIKQNIKNEMQTAEIAYTGDYKITWKSSKPRETIDTKTLKKDAPDIFEKYKKIGNAVRTFKVMKM